ncbi:CRISPR-associated helicase/endonuclease Cas3 [Pseudothermotoga thermarum]|uniref:CRISPR-associated HD domain protein n=1 Tax=Pseudothermotoga thermarum DSM 5069 TaxID=688269 RepID=F7YVS3_9THEM|nr:CRISPR-associated helicase/endonuclease Cas3 [Pseudothermotoga thermarum]AEH51743.1 CRISPR-associated HD domain protein [Pseudothermotoga thermarum DSM 5069]
MLDRLKSHEDRYLIDHLDSVTNLMLKKGKLINWEFFDLPWQKMEKILKVCGYCHDYAKATSYFQEYIEKRRKKGVETNHALLSAIVGFEASRKLGLDGKTSAFIYLVIKHHHDRLDNFGPFEIEHMQILQNQIKTISDEFKRWVEQKLGIELELSLENEIKKIKRLFLLNTVDERDYLFVHLLLSLLASADMEDAAFHGLAPSWPEGGLTGSLIDNYVSKIPRKTSIDELRQRFYKSTLEKLKKAAGNVFSVTAPTGVGKTLVNLRIAAELVGENGLIVYCLPFISIIDQTVKVIERLFSSEIDANILLPYHHLADPEYKEYEYDKPNEQQTRVLIEDWHSKIVVTTFVSLFESLFTNRKVPFLHKLSNAVIILDEVQAVPYKYWEPIKIMLSMLSKLGTKIILSTATQPGILDNCTELADRNLFKDLDRTKINFCGEIFIEDFAEKLSKLTKEKLIKGQKMLVICNTIRESQNLYLALREAIGSKDIYYLSASVIPKHRLERISKLKSLSKPVICISTQVVEAGVDLSFDYVIRDEGPMDSVVQAVGRCNRNFEKKLGIADIFTVKDERRALSKYIYDSINIDVTRRILEKNKTFSEQQFHGVVEEYFQEIKLISNQDKENLCEKLRNLMFDEIATSFRLIEDKGETVAVYIEYDDEAIQLRKEYNQIVEDNSLTKFEKLAKLSKKYKQMSSYIVDVRIDKRLVENALVVEHGLIVVPSDQLDLWYDKTTGFGRKDGIIEI